MNLRTAFSKASIELNKFGSDKLDAKILLLKAIDKDEKYLILNPLFPLTNSEYSKFRRYIRRRLKGEPIAYIVGHKEFYGLDFKVNKNVLIPRPETEMLVEQAIQYLKTKERKNLRTINIIDIGTGSGCIIISLVKKLSAVSCQLSVKFFGSDISKKALNVAKFNAKKHGTDREIKFFNSDLFSNRRLPKKFDLIIANLPYLKSGYKNLEFEPRSALDGGDDGLNAVRKMIKLLPEKLNSRGIALLEIDNGQFGQVEKMVNKFELLKISQIKTIPGWHGTIKIENK